MHHSTAAERAPVAAVLQVLLRCQRAGDLHSQAKLLRGTDPIIPNYISNGRQRKAPLDIMGYGSGSMAGYTPPEPRSPTATTHGPRMPFYQQQANLAAQQALRSQEAPARSQELPSGEGNQPEQGGTAQAPDLRTAHQPEVTWQRYPSRQVDEQLIRQREQQTEAGRTSNDVWHDGQTPPGSPPLALA